MAGEFAVINPRRRRHRRKRARARASRPRRHRRRRAVAYNPRPRRRHRRAFARRHHRRARRNPSFGGGGGSPVKHLTNGIGIGVGAVATNVATGFISKFLPAGMQTGPGYLAVKAGVGLIALPMLLKFIPGGRRFAVPVAVGAGVVIFLDIIRTYVAPMAPQIPGLSDYEQGLLSDYERGLLSGYGDPNAGEGILAAAGGQSVYSGGIYGG